MIRMEQVGKVYPGGVSALSDVSLSIGAGELVGVVGPSGSGKSTMLHLLGALDRPSVGTVRIDGYDVSALPDRSLSAVRARTIGFVFQQFHLAKGVSALDNVATACSTPACGAESGGAGRLRRWSGSGSGTGYATDRTSCPAGSANGWRSRVPWSVRRRCCWPTSRPATSTRWPAPG
jgi:ABC-type branched-subunit amino acid transport system ATPase component